MKNLVEFEVHSFKKEKIIVYKDPSYELREDFVAIEEPLEIKVKYSNLPDSPISLSTTMRTPGNDYELVAGFLYSEGLINDIEDIVRFQYEKNFLGRENINSVLVEIKSNESKDLDKFKRNVLTNSSCGLCSAVSIDQVYKRIQRLPRGDFKVNEELILKLPDTLNLQQSIFYKTGGVHASALFDKEGKLFCIMEDVGRHNAMDKLVGKMLSEKKIPLDDTIVLFSGRASFELVQKSIMAGIPFIAAIGAPSSLAIDLAKSFDVTLVGFLRNGRFNVYSGFHRLKEIDKLTCRTKIF